MFEDRRPTQKLEITSREQTGQPVQRKSPMPRSPSPQNVQINTGRLLDEVRKLQGLVRANNGKLFRGR
jgi:hypothetical protein